MESKINPKKEFPVGTILKAEGQVRIVGFSHLPECSQRHLHEIFNLCGLKFADSVLNIGDDIEFIEGDLPIADIGRTLKTGLLDISRIKQRLDLEAIDFNEIFEKAKLFADFLDKNNSRIRDALKHYETYGTVQDEINRSTELLRNLDKNKEYFEQRAPSIATFMPLNQPLYALVCFGIVPSMMCKEAHVRPPTFAHSTLKSLQEALNLDEWFSNLHISYEDRSVFVERTKKSVGGGDFCRFP